MRQVEGWLTVILPRNRVDTATGPAKCQVDGGIKRKFKPDDGLQYF